MARRRHTPAQAIDKPAEAAAAIAGRGAAAEAARRIGATGHTFYPWRSDCGGPGIDQARRLKRLALENSRLEPVAADLAPDNRILAQASGGEFWALHVVAAVSTALATPPKVSQQGGAKMRQPPVLPMSAWTKAASCCGDATLSVLC